MNLKQITVWKPPENRSGYLRLDLNENIYAPPNKIIKKLRKFSRNVLTSYPEYQNLVQLLSKYTKIPSKKIFISNGADQAIDVILRALFDKNDKVVIPSPVFSIYYHCLKLCSAKIVPTYYKAMQFPFQETMAQLKGAKGLVLINPCNPIGTTIPRKQVLELIKECKKKNIYIIVDEAYYEFYGETVANLLSKYKNLIVIRTFSKYFGMPGLRLGYALADESLVQKFLKVRGPWDINSFAVYAAEMCLNNLKPFEKIKNKINKAKKELCDFFIKKNIQTWATGTNFLVIKVKDSKQLKNKLRKNNILVKDLSSHVFSQGLLKNALRVSIPIGKDLKHFKNQF